MTFEEGSLLDELDKQFDEREKIKQSASSSITSIIVGEEKEEREVQVEKDRARLYRVGTKLSVTHKMKCITMNVT